MPYSDGGKLLAKNNYFLSTNLSIASNSTNALTPNEVVYFDGEMMRLDLYLAYAFSDRFEIGLNVPIVRHSGGFMDSSIDGFHRFIGINGELELKLPKMNYDMLIFRMVSHILIVAIKLLVLATLA